MSCGDKFSEMPGLGATVERRALNGALAGVTIKWQNNISGETFASRRTNTQVVRHSEPGLFTLTAIPLGARRAQLSGAGDGKRFGGGGPGGARGWDVCVCVWGGVWGSAAEVCMQWGVCQGTRDKAMITHNEESRVHADTNAVRGETRDRALVTTVRGRCSTDRRHYG